MRQAQPDLLRQFCLWHRRRGVGGDDFCAIARDAVAAGGAVAADVFGDPFVGGHFHRLDPLHELVFGIHLRKAGPPGVPDEPFGFARHVRGFVAFVACFTNAFAVFAGRAAWAGDTEFFALRAPADDLDALLFADELADFFTGADSAAAGAFGRRAGRAEIARGQQSNEQTTCHRT